MEHDTLKPTPEVTGPKSKPTPTKQGIVSGKLGVVVGGKHLTLQSIEHSHCNQPHRFHHTYLQNRTLFFLARFVCLKLFWVVPMAQDIAFPDDRELTICLWVYACSCRFDFGTFYPSGDDGSHTMVGEGLGAGYNINVPWEHGRSSGIDESMQQIVYANWIRPIQHLMCYSVTSSHRQVLLQRMNGAEDQRDVEGNGIATRFRRKHPTTTWIEEQNPSGLVDDFLSPLRHSSMAHKSTTNAIITNYLEHREIKYEWSLGSLRDGSIDDLTNSSEDKIAERKVATSPTLNSPRVA
ncbi:hypothetical protein IFM89_033099 [Coptis chinensis]|uniref:Uncharacterized protein n=1 Tax=Coptis chinensis TaxID=261450 RepID=A0A835IHB1_9MAGN|nr:hypothetical protein IFM89_033099 [Coptis chinensis]